MFAYLLLPYSEVGHQPFPFYKFKPGYEITWQTYYDYIFTRISILILLSVIVKLTPASYRDYAKTFWWLWFGYLIEYFLVFNQPFGWWYFVPLSYSLAAGISMAFLTFSKKWKTY
jgi:hypothetical protein